MNISIFKNMFDTHVHELMELEKDYENEDAQTEAEVRRNAFSYKLRSLGISFCGYEGSVFFVYFEDGRIETI